MFLINYHETLTSFLADEFVSNNFVKLTFALDSEKFQVGSSESRVYVLNVWLTAVDDSAEKIKSLLLKVYFDQFVSLQERIIETLEEVAQRVHNPMSIGHYAIPGVVPPISGLHISRFVQEIQRDCPSAVFEEYLSRLGKIFKELE